MERCAVCGLWGDSRYDHRCPPSYDYKVIVNGDDGGDRWEEVYGHNHADAAVRAVAEFEEYAGETFTLNGLKVEVVIRDKAGVTRRFRMGSRVSISYVAEEIEGEDQHGQDCS